MSIMNEDNTNKCFSDDYLGPNCLYKLIDNRISRNGRLYLNRNLRYKERVQKKVPESYCISIKTIKKNIDHNERYLIALVSVNLTTTSSSNSRYNLALSIHDINDTDISYDGEINLKVDPIATISKDEYEDRSLLLIITTTVNESSKYHDEIQQKLLSFFKHDETNNDNDLTPICIVELNTTNIKVPNTINFKMLAERRKGMYRSFPSSSSSSSSKYINATLSTMKNDSDSNDNIDIMINIKYGKQVPLRLSKHNNKTLKRKYGSNDDNTCDHDDIDSLEVFFHYIFKDDDTDSLESIVEKTRIIGCPFCNFNPCSESKMLDINPSNKKWTQSTVKRVSCLVEHMEACHIHFKFEIFMFDNNLHVFTVRDRSQDDGVSYRKSILQNFFFYRRKGQQNKLIEAVPAIPDESDLRKLDRKTHQKILSSQLYHATTGVPAIEEEFFYDSDDDIDNSQALMQVNLDIFEFEDISYEEKLFMCLWNNHINSLSVFADCYLLSVCTLFIHRHANYILKNGLRHNLLLHLMNLYDCNLLRAEEIPILMAELDIVKAKESL